MDKDIEKELLELLEKFSLSELNERLKLISDREKKRKKEAEEAEKKKKEEAELEKKKEEEQARIQGVISLDLPDFYNNPFDSEAFPDKLELDTAFVTSLRERGRVDIEYISAATGLSLRDVIEGLGDAVFQNPESWEECFYKGFETRDEYLTGNLFRKYTQAQKLNEIYPGYFDKNLEAIKAAMPLKVEFSDIFVTLGTPWLPEDIANDFVNFLFRSLKNRYLEPPRVVSYEASIHRWTVRAPYYFDESVANNTGFGTARMSALVIIEKTLNHKPIEVFDSVMNSPARKRKLNVQETAAAQEKQRLILEKFKKWLSSDEKRVERIENVYMEKFGAVRTRHFDGSYIGFPDMSDAVKLYDYQKNSVARIIQTPNCLLAHDVGAGKTYVMIAAGMELRRMGVSRKNMFVVPNNIVGQWTQCFKTMYPKAKLMVVTPSNFKRQKRFALLSKLRDEDFDGIIIAYSCFDLIPVSKEALRKDIESSVADIEAALKSKGKAYNTALWKEHDRLKKALQDIEKTFAKQVLDNRIFFDEIGVNTLFLDEAHNYKNIGIKTTLSTVKGISPSGAVKSREMIAKLNTVREQNSGRGVVLATGTPITNSMTDLYVMQRYVQPGELKLLDLYCFENWVGMFGETIDECEVDVDVNDYRVITRFAKFHNLPELSALLCQAVDFYKVNLSDLPEIAKERDVRVSKSPEQEALLQEIAKRIEKIRDGSVKRIEDNMLKVTTDGRKLALDVRLLEPTASVRFTSKVFACAEKLYTIWKRTAQERKTQMVFCDIGTPKASYNVYDELRGQLVAFGIPSNEIEFIHDATSEAKKALLLNKLRIGAVRIIVGSTPKLGLGVNVQDRLIALHHLDVPWRPSDMTQREGRILRQGNMNDEVHIFRYITEGTFDAYSWQILEGKQRFISQILSGSVAVRESREVDDTVLSYAEVKALAIGNPLIKKRVETNNELMKLRTLKNQSEQKRLELSSRLAVLPQEIARLKERVVRSQEDAESYLSVRDEEVKGKVEMGMRILEAVKDSPERTSEVEVLTYRGFVIAVPAKLFPSKPYIILRGKNDYIVEVKDSAVGIIIRIDGFLNNFYDYIARLTDNLSRLMTEKSDTEAELEKDETYSDNILALEKELKKLDKKLGIEE